MKRKEDIGKLLQKRLEGAEKRPNSVLWERISDSLDKKERKKRRFLYFWLGGAGFGIALLLLLWNPWNSDIKNDPEVPSVTVTTTSEENKITVENTKDTSDSNNTENHSTTTSGITSEENTENNTETLENMDTANDSQQNNENNTISTTEKLSEKKTNDLSVSENSKNSSDLLPNDKAVKNTGVTAKPVNKNSSQNDKNTENATDSDLEIKKTTSNPVNPSEKISDSGKVVNERTNDTVTSFGYYNSDTGETVNSKRQETIDSVRNAYEQRLLQRKQDSTERAETRDSILKIRSRKRDSIQAIRKAKQDSLSVDQEVKDSIPEPETFSMSWGLSPIIAPVYFGIAADGSAIDDEFTGFTKDGSTSISYGIEVYWRILERFRLSYGFLLSNFSNTTNDIPAANEAERLRILNFSDTEPAALDSFLGPENTVNLYQEIRYLEMPLQLTYVFGNSDLGIQVYGGGTFYALMKDEVFAEDADGNRLSLGSASNLSPVNISLDIGAGLYYNFSDKISLDVKPTYKYHINTVRALNFEGKTYSMGIYTGLRYRF
ncbi:outer membrane beta-barrel protein [Constantimarinum furrinae]|uniref:Outer membrane protein beta-barrel domain-containing protein n=1 Tax=Constantimarinum furrinae TaxID=2562285 RepID=A0A7G8PRF0_9FLAO|nr:outer membrane beta-barrel protein [Constantimarinum furrinae]QNJ96916.1 hypothetical protein ALE3EI_0329 [Constantimarinum furrinae]